MPGRPGEAPAARGALRDEPAPAEQPLAGVGRSSGSRGRVAHPSPDWAPVRGETLRGLETRSARTRPAVLLRLSLGL